MIRDVDSAEQVRRVQLGLWALVAGALGAFVGAAVADTAGRSGALGALVGGIAAGAGLFVIVGRFAAGVGAGAASVLVPSGASTRSRSEYSQAEALVVRGDHAAAADLYGRAAAADPSDPEPCLRLARLYRDGMDRSEDAAAMLDEARRRAAGSAREVAIARELIELFLHRMHQPARARPLLAELAERFAEQPVGQWARSELERTGQ